MRNPIPKKSEWIALLCLFALDLSLAAARAQNPVLDRERERLDREQMALDLEKKSFNADCGRVQPGDAEKLGNCQKRQLQFTARLRKYMDDLAAYEKRVRDSEPVVPPSDLRDAPAPKPPDNSPQKSVWKAIRSSLNSPGELYARSTRHFFEALSDKNLREFLQMIYGQYHSSRLTADDVRNELVSKAALEEARTRAIEDLQSDVARLKSLQAMLARDRQELERDPEWRETFRKNDAFLREVEMEADRRMKSGLVVPDDEDLFALFNPQRQVRVWPGPRNPNEPLPNPLASEAQFEKIRELVLWERREQNRIDRLFQNHPELLDYLFEDVVPRVKR